MTQLVNMTEATSLALHGLGLLAGISPDRLAVKQAAHLLNASEAHLAKVFATLQKKGWVKSVRGPTGGYELAVNPDEVSFLEIYELFETRVETQGCPLGRPHCAFGKCMFDSRINKVTQEIYRIMKETRISDLTITPLTKENAHHD